MRTVSGWLRLRRLEVKQWRDHRRVFAEFARALVLAVERARRG